MNQKGPKNIYPKLQCVQTDVTTVQTVTTEASGLKTKPSVRRLWTDLTHRNDLMSVKPDLGH